MLTARLLQAFCAGTDERRLDRPFSFGKWTYATDLVVAVRVPRLEEVGTVNATDEDSTAGRLSRTQFPNAGDCAYALPALPARLFDPCLERVAIGAAHCRKDCPECHGVGRVARIRRVQIGCDDFNSEYLRLLKMFLRNVRTNQPSVAGAHLWFTFEGGAGILQPMTGPY